MSSPPDPRRLFFCHATEDKPIVEQVAARLLQHRPDVHVWIDKYEVVAGHDLLGAIGEGMDNAEKLFVFISPASVGKPWVTAELRDALTQDVAGGKPGFVVPVLVKAPSSFPPFLRAKKYIDLSALPDVWLREFDGVLAGAFGDAPTVQPNLIVKAQLGPGPAGTAGGGGANTLTLMFQATYFAEEVNFAVRTRREVVALRAYSRPHIGVSQMVQSCHGLDGAAYRVGSPPLAAEASLYMELDFDGPASLDDLIAWGPWGAPSAFV